MLGARKGSTPLSYNLQPNAQYLFDPVTRRAVRYVETIVPTINLSESAAGDYYPADRYFMPVGAMSSTSNLPTWAGSAINISFRNWDTSQKAFYARFSTVAADGYIGVGGAPIRMIYPLGPFGQASSHAPKNSGATAVWIKFTGRFNANADYTIYGVGATNDSATLGFGTSTKHFIQVLRNAGAWELGSCDGSTISQSSGGTGDGSVHEFWVRWSATELTLYVDGVSTITKTTNLPTEALGLQILAHDSTNTLDLFDYEVEWEAA